MNNINLEQIKNSEAEGADYKVAFIADTHNYYEDLDQLVGVINTNGPYRFVIVAGDVTNLGLLEEYNESRRLFNKLNFPYLIAPGNHDLLSNGDKIFNKMFGLGDFSFDYQGTQFILLNNNSWESGGIVPDLEWLKKALIGSSSMIKLIIAHVPPQDRERFSNQQITALTNLISTYGVDYFINGHNHNPALGMIGTAIQITIGAPSKGEYLELIFQSGSVTYQKILF